MGTRMIPEEHTEQCKCQRKYLEQFSEISTSFPPPLWPWEKREGTPISESYLRTPVLVVYRHRAHAPIRLGCNHRGRQSSPGIGLHNHRGTIAHFTCFNIPSTFPVIDHRMIINRHRQLACCTRCRVEMDAQEVPESFTVCPSRREGKQPPRE